MTIIDVANILADQPRKVFKMANTIDLEITADDEGYLVGLDGEKFPFWVVDVLRTDWEEVGKES